MLLRLLLLFTLVPVAELMVLIELGEAIGLGPTLVLIFATGVVGAWLARREGARSWLEVQRELARGELPADSLLQGLMILVAGAFLVTPGVLTDAAGFLLLARPVRSALVDRLRGWLRRKVESGDAGVSFGRSGSAFYWSSGGGPAARDMRTDEDEDEGSGTDGAGRVIEM
ncbi:MAG: FxsA family protein [Gemmatimonadota bacterium]